MRILIVTQSVDSKNPVLGFFVDWINEFAKNFSLVTVICLEKGSFHVSENVRLFSLGKEEKISKILYLFRFFKYIFKERKQYDVVFVHMNPIYVILGGFFWKICNKKIGLWYTHKHVDFKLKIATLLSNFIFSASKESFRINTKKLIVTGHGININLFKCKESHTHIPLRLVTVGRISEIKQTNKCVEILESLIKRGVVTTLTIVGDALTDEDRVYKQNINNYIQSKKIEKNILFKGMIEHEKIPEILLDNDIFLHTSKTGSVDKVVLEALLSGLLVITENEAFKNSLSSPRMFINDMSVESFVNTILFFINNKESFNKSVKDGRMWVIETHGLNNLIPKIRQSYE